MDWYEKEIQPEKRTEAHSAQVESASEAQKDMAYAQSTADHRDDWEFPGIYQDEGLQPMIPPSSHLEATQELCPESSTDAYPHPPETSMDSGYADTLDDPPVSGATVRPQRYWAEWDGLYNWEYGGMHEGQWSQHPTAQASYMNKTQDPFQEASWDVYLDPTLGPIPRHSDFNSNYDASHFDQNLIDPDYEFEPSHLLTGPQNPQYERLQGPPLTTPIMHRDPEGSTMSHTANASSIDYGFPQERSMPARGSKRKLTNEEEAQIDLLSQKRAQLVQQMTGLAHTQTNQTNTPLASQSSASEENESLMSDSKETDITRPDPEDDSIDSGIIDGRSLDHLLDSTHYFNELDQLELETARLLGMKTGPDIALETVNDCLVHLEKWKSALVHLHTQGFCGTSMNILVEEKDTDHVAKALPVTLEKLIIFIEEITRFEGKFLEQQTGEWIQALLRSNEADTVNLSPVDSLRILCSILSIGLIAFSGSHVCRFDVTNWGQQMEQIPIGLDQYAFRPRKLACLDDFIGGPAWVLGKTEDPQTAPSSHEKKPSQSSSENGEVRQCIDEESLGQHPGMKVSISVQEFDELWGPISLVGGFPERGLAIRTERGFILPLPRDQQSDSLTSLREEIECHWTPEIPRHILEGRVDEDTAVRPMSLCRSSRILIGTGTSSGVGLVVNEKCKSSIPLIQQQIACRLQYPGTCNSKYVKDGLDLQFGGGQYITGGLVRKYKRMPKRTLKAMLLEDCKKPDTRLVPLLSLRIGLEVSACTGNAQRVTLWDALRLSQTGVQAVNVPYCGHKIGDRHCISTCWTRCHSDDEIDSFEDQQAYGKPLSGPQARRVIINSILALEHTGLDSEGNLQVAWPFSDTPANCPVSPSTAKESNNWFRIVKETRETSSFPVFSQQCLEFHDRDLVRSCSAPCKTGHVRPPQTILSTQLLTLANGGPVLGLLEGARFLVGEAHLTVTKTVQGQLAIVATVSMNPLSPLRHRFRELLPDAPTHGFKENIRPDIAVGLSVPVYVH